MSVLFFSFIADTLLLRQGLARRRYTALAKWTDALEVVHSSILAKTIGHMRGVDSGTGMIRPVDGSFEGLLGFRELESSRNIW